jgi:hypothetical protein
MAGYKARGFLQIAESKVPAPDRPSNKSGVGIIAGRSQLRRATLSLPTHREVVAAAFRISALGAPHSKEPPAPVRSLLRVCIPRRRDSITYLRRIAQNPRQ